jgi:hypothetical protein
MQRSTEDFEPEVPIKQPIDPTDNQRRKLELSDPFDSFIEWWSAADEKAYGSL